MALFRVQVNYVRSAGEKWSNVWHCDASTIGDAATEWTVTGVPDLLPLLDNSCEISSLLISDPASDAFRTVAINETGTSTGSGDMLPLFNCAKAIFPVPGDGRPDLKYIKGFVTESLQNDGFLTSGAQGEVDTRLTTLITDMNAAGVPLVSSQGEAYSNVSVQSAVQMRQMHRKRRRTVVTP